MSSVILPKSLQALAESIARDESLNCAFSFTIHGRDNDLLQLLDSDSIGDINYVFPHTGSTLLLAAVRANRTTTAELLLAYGADPRTAGKVKYGLDLLSQQVMNYYVSMFSLVYYSRYMFSCVLRHYSILCVSCTLRLAIDTFVFSCTLSVHSQLFTLFVLFTSAQDKLSAFSLACFRNNKTIVKRMLVGMSPVEMRVSIISQDATTAARRNTEVIASEVFYCS